MNALLFHMCDFNDSMKPQQRKEHLKLVSVAAEVFDAKLAPFFPKLI